MEKSLKVGIKLLKGEKYLPKKAYGNDACYDVYATSVEFEDSTKIIYGLGFALELEDGWRADIRPRSSIHKTGLVLSNSVGTGDAGFKGEYKSVFYKVLPQTTVYKVGERIGQIKFERVQEIDWNVVEELSESKRGTGGFGSSGTKEFTKSQTFFKDIPLDSLFNFDGEEFIKISFGVAFNLVTGQTAIFEPQAEITIRK